MNPYIRNLNRIEFVVTNACTGRCKHCSQGEHTGREHIDGSRAVQVIYRLCDKFHIDSLMTFGGEPLLCLEEVCKIHTAAREMNIPERRLITNGFFTRDVAKIQNAAVRLARSGVESILLSVDAFHQETIPLEPVQAFAKAVKAAGISLRTHPAWLVDKDAENPYNQRTHEILEKFELMGIAASEGNNIFPSGNALKYLEEYFESSKNNTNPYIEDPEDVRAICVSPNGDVLGGNINQMDILDIINNYVPE